METLEQLYEAYNFSATRCYVVGLDIPAKGYLRIEHKLPAYIKQLKGIYITISGFSQNAGSASGNNNNKTSTTNPIAGFITLNFNGQSLKCFQYNVPLTMYLTDCSKAIPFNEEINKNSFMQGYYFDNMLYINPKLPYRVSIYLHYKP